MIRASGLAQTLSLIGVLSLSSASCDGRFSTAPGQDGSPLAAGGTSVEMLERQLSDIESALRAAIEYQAILDNELRYTRGLDRHDEQLINDSFWPDAEASYGVLVPMNELAVWANQSHAAYAVHQHHVTGLAADVEGDVAHVESYIIFSSDTKRDAGLDQAGPATPGRVPAETFATLGTGRYLNQYARRDDLWKLRVHEYAHEISLRLRAVDLCAEGCLGRWDQTDLSYRRPLSPLPAEERRQRIEQGKTPHKPNN